MKKYDVVIIGGGPAGGQCARELTQAGFKVLIADKAKSFLENNYSSGGAPLTIMADFNLPDSIVGTYWNTLRINSTKARATWTATSPFGPVIDFDKLRTFVVEEAKRNGGEFQLSCQYQSHQVYSHCIEVYLKDLGSSTIYPVQATVVVDATGTERKVLAQQHYDKDQAIAATGIEYHVEVENSSYQKYSKALNFFLGHHWMPQGYAWIFPMAPSTFTLKVGVIRYFQNKNYVPYEPSYKPYLERLLALCGSYKIKDKHGKTIYYTERQKDLRYRGPIIAIGDAISSVNPLGWEGIRHAMMSGRFAARTIQSYLKGEVKDLSSYDQALHQYFGQKWFFSEKFMNHLFKMTKDSLIDRSVISFSAMSNEEIIKVIFNYQFRYTLKSYFWYFLSRLMHSNGQIPGPQVER
jgi:digeranylgeranylglycerophospholipid reductase